MQQANQPDGQKTQVAASDVRPAKFAHAVLRTRKDLNVMVDWYTKVLNAHIVFSNEYMAFLSYDDEHHRIAVVSDPGLAERPHRSAGLDHLAFTYADLDALLATYTRLKGHGILPFLPVNHGPTTSLYYVDPDENRIELQVDNFADMDDATTLMEATFGANPIGEEFNPDEMVARRQAGATADELTRPSQSPDAPKLELIVKLISS